VHALVIDVRARPQRLTDVSAAVVRSCPAMASRSNWNWPRNPAGSMPVAFVFRLHE